MPQIFTFPRRSLLAGLAAVPVLAACGTDDAAEPTAGGSAASAGFSYTDARGTTIDLPEVPTVVVAQSSAAAALWDAGFKVKGAYGELTETDGQLGFQAGNLDLADITVLGKTFGEFDIEKLAGMGAQLLVDLSFDNKLLWYVDAKVEKQVLEVTPTLGVDMPKRNLLKIIGAFTDLAVMLGADPATSQAAKADFDAEEEKLKTLFAANKGLKIAGISLDAKQAYIANADQHPDFAYLKTLGAEFVDARTEEYFATVSYEKLGDYSGDLILRDARNTVAAEDFPTFQALPAAKAGLVFPWYAAAPYSYAWSVGVLKGINEAYTKAATAA